jgi:hypothetical protein
MNREIIILGFPKCGTTALVDDLGRQPDVEVLAAANGSPEYAWPLFKTQPEQSDPSKVRVHKFTSYAYNDAALRFLAENHGNALYVVCVRQSVKALLSWHRMHRDIAVTGRDERHFAYKDRDFYSTCTVAEYYARYAKDRLKYDEIVSRISSIFLKNRFAVVSQERMSVALQGISSELVGIAKSGKDTGIIVENATPAHISYAENAGIQVPKEITLELTGVDARLQAFLRTSDWHKFI